MPPACEFSRKRTVSWYILNHVVQYQQTDLDASFAALPDITRRGILEQLGRADASMSWTRWSRN